MTRRLFVVLSLLLLASPVSAQWITQNGIAATRFPIRLIPITQPTATVLEGTFYYDATAHTFKVWSGTAWVPIGNVSASALGTTSTDGLTLANPTPANATTTVQISPRLKWCGTAWNSTSLVSETDCLFIEVLPATVAGTTTATFKIGYINTAGTVTYPGTLTSAGAWTATTLGANKFIGAGFRLLTGFGSGLASLTDATEATGEEINLGSATLGTCTGGTITTGSHNFAGGYTGNTSSSCVVNFGTPAWTNAPFCVAMSIASTTHPRVSAVSTSAITVTGGVSGEAITYLCSGRIGT